MESGLSEDHQGMLVSFMEITACDSTDKARQFLQVLLHVPLSVLLLVCWIYKVVRSVMYAGCIVGVRVCDFYH